MRHTQVPQYVAFTQGATISHRKPDNSAFIVNLGNGHGRIFDPQTMRVYPPFPMPKLLNESPWLEVSAEDEIPDIQMLYRSGALGDYAERSRSDESLGYGNDKSHKVIKTGGTPVIQSNQGFARGKTILE